MASVPPSTLRLPNPLFSSLLAPSPPKPHAPLKPPSFPTRATADESSSSSEPASQPDPDSFEDRLSQVRLRYRSGTGKKAEIRKVRKGKKASSSSPAGIFLPPVPLKEPVSGGLKVEFGFSPYSERVNGRVAILGLSALLLVDLATGTSVIRYHSPAILFVQVYFIAAVTAVYVKYEKEKVSVWPQEAPNPTQE
ncbi:Beta-glucosidase btgE precursor [Actinidia chinensis var. chinensis]|uniref:Beta-glucosidase btgE n=1 Tax=Actinidia chinensis var. chinensis TaxID=1590841 RepID=A0A2R6RTV0_ACTCC|nr:Beta-glucosidase btgE precursor [Actinidia chinensis var. chinensis]